MSHSVYIHNIEDYNAKYLARHFSSQIVGSALNEGEEEAIEEDEDLKASKEKYLVYSTECSPAFCNLNINYIPKSLSLSDFFDRIKQCRYFIFNIIDNPECIDGVRDIIDIIIENADSFKEQKVIILLSTILTWARSKIPDEDDPEIPFTDEDYCRRIAHANYRRHLDFEKEVLKLGKNLKPKILTYVVTSGVTYGEEESIFHSLFFNGWHNETSLEIPGSGQNVIPTIHLNDLSKIVQSVIEYRPLIKYILATDDSQNTLYEIARAVSNAFTTGKVRRIPKEEFYKKKGVNQHVFDHLLINMRIDPAFVKESFSIKWYCETGLVENIRKVSKEYRLARNLIPFKICLLGAPLSGKTSIVADFARQYKIHHIQLNEVLEETIKELEISAARLNAPKEEKLDENQEFLEEQEDEEEQDLEAKATEDAEMLETLQANKIENNGQLDLEYVIQFLKKKLKSKPCMNQGFIIDGFPTTREEAENLFNADDEEDDDDEEEHKESEEVEDPKSMEQTKKISSIDIMENMDPTLIDELKARDATVKDDSKLAALDAKIADDQALRNLRAEPKVFEQSPLPKTLSKGIVPTHTFILQASDEFLRDRAMHLPESEWQSKKLSEDAFIQRLAHYRMNELGANSIILNSSSAIGIETGGSNSSSSTGIAPTNALSNNALTPLAESAVDEDSLIAFLEDQGIVITSLDVTKQIEESITPNKRCVETMKVILGSPRNYGRTEEEIAQEIEHRTNEERIMMLKLEQERNLLLEEDAAKRESNEKLWNNSLKTLSDQEESWLEDNTKPVKGFLAKHIMPTLINGLINTYEVQPEDPVEHLAKYIFYNNPQI